MKLITEVPVPAYPFRIDHQTPVLMMGSCFTDNIGMLMEKYLFQISVNPFGVIYNPLSIKNGLEALLYKESYTVDDLDHHNNLWFSFDHYTLFSSPDPMVALGNINSFFLPAKKILQKASLLILTWGTAWVYRNNSSGKVVCNCHKIKASNFSRSRLTVSDIVSSYKTLLPLLFEKNPSLKVLVNVSPVRHWKDGPHGNQLSKSILLLAQEALEKLYPKRIYYFPSYEIVMDELRDYRFFTRDMVHPSDLATQYIWGKFQHALVSPESQKIMNELEGWLKMMDHKLLNQDSEATRQMVVRRDQKAKDLMSKYPFLEWKNRLEK